ncbi:MAG: hypothetical protein ACW9W4_06310 [Candidatus Nitrosopumilus sp. bin_7KS]
MFPQAAIIEALKEQKRNNNNLYTRTREILKENNMSIVKQQFTDAIKSLVQAGVLSKKKLPKQTGNPVEYSISKGDHAQNQAQLILDVGAAPSLTDNFKDILNQSEIDFSNIQDSNEKNKESSYDAINEDLILLSSVLSPVIAKMILYQTKSIENLYLLKELRRIERLARGLFDKAGVLSLKLGKERYNQFINTFDHEFTKELSSRYQKLLRDNTTLTKDS